MPPTPDATQAPSVGPDRGRADACPGALRLHAAEDGHLARLRLPGGQLTHRQMNAVADAADALGNGDIEITSRGNAQLRGLTAHCAADLAERLRAVGLLPSDTHERVRNIVASPLAGLDGHGTGGEQITDWVRELDLALCAAPWAAALSGKFLFALDDGRGDVAALDADVTLIAVGDGRALLRYGRAPRATAVDTTAGTPVAAALDAARRILDLAAGRAWHAREIQHALPAGDTPLPPPLGGGRTALGRLPGALSVAPRLGRASSAQWRLLAEALGPAAPDRARLTPWRGVVLPHADPDWLPRLAAAGFRTAPGGPWEGVTACTGLPGCAKSRADVRAQAARAVAAAPATGLPVHWSGCERRCGHPAGRWVDVLATPTGHRVTLDGATRDTAPDETAGAVAAARATQGASTESPTVQTSTAQSPTTVQSPTAPRRRPA
ncbi:MULTISPECIES: putative precorrin-3B synthase [Kitasatospora]|uniref:Putative precorrin-3B synthase n=1 Tax=Kitasatospora setae (strain ATCC 33774 / DSM 43861 / JCM 3304 / KCC A-0304 / NBRC 14216 / KM-6054) TaxID=452652 RepID=E4N257_KITSK|nr:MULTISPECIES: putative precorrin-3B synthase [Kitasatospora]BAJ32241.1 putative precorrin-3B synthase [Kitasatospora setae KM-6054]